MRLLPQLAITSVLISTLSACATDVISSETSHTTYYSDVTPTQVAPAPNNYYSTQTPPPPGSSANYYSGVPAQPVPAPSNYNSAQTPPPPSGYNSSQTPQPPSGGYYSRMSQTAPMTQAAPAASNVIPAGRIVSIKKTDTQVVATGIKPAVSTSPDLR